MPNSVNQLEAQAREVFKRRGQCKSYEAKGFSAPQDDEIINANLIAKSLEDFHQQLEAKLTPPTVVPQECKDILDTFKDQVTEQLQGSLRDPAFDEKQFTTHLNETIKQLNTALENTIPDDKKQAIKTFIEKKLGENITDSSVKALEEGKRFLGRRIDQIIISSHRHSWKSTLEAKLTESGPTKKLKDLDLWRRQDKVDEDFLRKEAEDKKRNEAGAALVFGQEQRDLFRDILQAGIYKRKKLFPSDSGADYSIEVSADEKGNMSIKPFGNIYNVTRTGQLGLYHESIFKKAWGEALDLAVTSGHMTSITIDFNPSNDNSYLRAQIFKQAQTLIKLATERGVEATLSPRALQIIGNLSTKDQKVIWDLMEKNKEIQLSGEKMLRMEKDVEDQVKELKKPIEPPPEVKSSSAGEIKAETTAKELIDRCKKLDERVNEVAKSESVILTQANGLDRMIKEKPEAMTWIEAQHGELKKLADEIKKQDSEMKRVKTAIQGSFDDLPDGVKQDAELKKAIDDVFKKVDARNPTPLPAAGNAPPAGGAAVAAPQSTLDKAQEKLNALRVEIDDARSRMRMGHP